MVSILRDRGAISAQACMDFLNLADSQQDITLCCGMCYLNRSFEEESALVNILTELNAIPPENLNPKLFWGFIQDYEKEKGFHLSEDQKNAVWTAMTRSICVITGGPGTGKSTILDAIRACWRSFRPSEQLSLMAPTGRAAVRMTEVTNEYASTVHSRLQLNIGNDSMNHMIDNDASVTDELVIVDETSMLDQPTSASLVAALKGRFENKTRQHLILVGDPNQLPSVSYGNVLADIIESGVIPVCSLNTVYRQASDNPIIENSIRIKNGNPDLLWTPTFKAFHNGSELANKVAVRKFFSACVKQYGIENVILLSPYRQKTDISTNALNTDLQDAINPSVGQPAIQYGKRQYRLHDWVMMLKNTESLSNGDIGTIVEVVQETAEQEAGVVVQFESGIKETFTKENLSRLDLAYALTVHKSQGGQYRVVIMILPDKPSTFLQRRVVYTGVTRAKEFFAVFGPRHVLSYAIRNDKYDKRYTGLVVRLRNANKNTNQQAA
jgi:exodeoxyribonuclease V alpha subunit